MLYEYMYEYVEYVAPTSYVSTLEGFFSSLYFHILLMRMLRVSKALLHHLSRYSGQADWSVVQILLLTFFKDGYFALFQSSEALPYLHYFSKLSVQIYSLSPSLYFSSGNLDGRHNLERVEGSEILITLLWNFQFLKSACPCCYPIWMWVWIIHGRGQLTRIN